MIRKYTKNQAKACVYGFCADFLSTLSSKISIIPDYKTRWVSNTVAALEDIKSSKAAACIHDLPIAQRAVKMNPELAVFPQLLFEEDYAYCFPKNSKYLIHRR